MYAYIRAVHHLITVKWLAYQGLANWVRNMSRRCCYNYVDGCYDRDLSIRAFWIKNGWPRLDHYLQSLPFREANGPPFSPHFVTDCKKKHTSMTQPVVLLITEAVKMTNGPSHGPWQAGTKLLSFPSRTLSFQHTHQNNKEACGFFFLCLFLFFFTWEMG